MRKLFNIGTLELKTYFNRKEVIFKDIENIYRIFGKHESTWKGEGGLYFSSSNLKTTDITYTFNVTNGMLGWFYLVPSEDGQNSIDLDRLLEIFSHLDLERTEYTNRRNPHVRHNVIYYKTKDRKFSIELGGDMGLTITWSRDEIPVPDFSPIPGISI